MKIAEAAAAARTSPRMLRYYEQEGLLSPDRGGNGYREYSADDLTLATRIVNLSAAGLTLDAIRVVLPCAVGDGTAVHLAGCPWVAPRLREQLASIRAQIDALSESAATVEQYLHEQASGASEDATGALSLT